MNNFWEQSVETWQRWIIHHTDVLIKLHKRQQSLLKQMDKVNNSIAYHTEQKEQAEENKKESLLQLQKEPSR